jgi:uncharacterized NAD(P)/FAD-binding protein YdhS
MAPPIADRVEAELAAGSLVKRRGSLHAILPSAQGALVQIRTGSGGRAEIAAARVINCTGPNMNYRRVGSPLMDSLFARGLAVAGPLGWGLWTDQAGALRNQDGSFSRILFNVGPGRQGTLLESIAVPELRHQAVELAGLLTAQLHDQARAEEDAASERASRTGSEDAALPAESRSPEALVGYDLAS